MKSPVHISHSQNLRFLQKNMDAVVFYPRTVICSPSSSNFSKFKLGQPMFSMKEIADGYSLFGAKKHFTRLTVSSIQANGNSRGRPPRKDDLSPDGKSSNQEEIIALFRRIQSSISKGESVSAKKRSSTSSEGKSSAETVLEVLRQSKKQVKDKTSSKKDNKESSQRRVISEKEKKIEDNHPSTQGVKVTRPPSNFVKRSPIPSPPSSTTGVELVELKNGVSDAIAGEKDVLEFRKLEEMKLSELKELAKSRGIKGYSKLKKSDLVELLRS